MKIQKATLVFLIKEGQGQIDNVCLAMKKRGFGKGRWNGTGGKVEPKEKIKEAAIRETEEEIGVRVKNLKKRAKLSFNFPQNPEWNQKVYVYLCKDWQGEPKETEEMKPNWFKPNKLPFENMWPDDPFWLPEVIKGNLVKGSFKFGENDQILEKNVKLTNKI
jgi:mutator protein MutT